MNSQTLELKEPYRTNKNGPQIWYMVYNNSNKKRIINGKKKRQTKRESQEKHWKDIWMGNKWWQTSGTMEGEGQEECKAPIGCQELENDGERSR